MLYPGAQRLKSAAVDNFKRSREYFGMSAAFELLDSTPDIRHKYVKEVSLALQNAVLFYANSFLIVLI